MVKVVKFGGSSLASAEQFKKAGAIIRADESRRYVVPSAPGKRGAKDTKVTDMLYDCYGIAEAGKEFSGKLGKIRDRYDSIIKGLDLKLSLNEEFKTIETNFKNRAGAAYAASRGEYLNGIIMAAYMGFTFIDAAEVIFFDAEGNFLADRTNEVLAQRLEKTDCAVIPGFYGAEENGVIHTFSRGGSDITGSIVARAVHATIYENWTDVSGFLVSDPRIIDNPAVIHTITYRELRELSYMGAGVLHEDAIFPVRKEGIPINIRNTNAPQEPGTMIVESTCRKVLQAFEDHEISIEHMPSGIDTMTVFVQRHDFEGKEQQVLSAIHRYASPDTIEIEGDLALVAVVGRGMKSTRGTAGRIFSALAHAQINVKMIDQGSSELNIIVGVNNEDYEKCIKAIYNEFFALN